jgi:acetyl-CoA carboxylase carboxyl transferase subunit beta
MLGIKRPEKPERKLDFPDGLWLRCESCNEILYRKTLEQNLFVCPRCNFHFRIGCRKYVEILLDEGRLDELDADLAPQNPLGFPEYLEKTRQTQAKTGLKEAFIYGRGKIGGVAVAFGAMDFSFVGGSMGSVVGEKVARAIRLGREESRPVVIVATSGGARMQEGILSLMQMAKTSAELALLGQARIPYVAILINPCTAGVMASFASLGDVIVAEPGALLGFAGPRVIETTIGEKLPEGFQRSEFMLKHGLLDVVVSRRDLKETMAKVLTLLWSTHGHDGLTTKTPRHQEPRTRNQMSEKQAE